MVNATTYCAMAIVTEQDGTVKAPNTRYFTDRNEAERQFHLYCAAAATSDSAVYTVMLMTTEGFQLETPKVWKHDVPAPEPEPEPTPEPEVEPTPDPEPEEEEEIIPE